MSTPDTVDVLVVGAGPTGLVLAIWLTRLRLRVRIIAKAAGPGTASRALVVQARTLELYQPLGLTAPVLQRGRPVRAMNLWIGGKSSARIPLGDLGTDLTPYPYLEVFPQEEHEALLVSHLQSLGVEVQWSTELLHFTDHGTHVSAVLRDAAGQELPCQAHYLAGCDGAHSTIRAGLGIDFPGGTYPHSFYVADIEGTGPPLNGEGHIAATDGDFLLILPMAGAGRARLVGQLAAGSGGEATFEELSRRTLEAMQLTVTKVHWFSAYRVHHRVAAAFRKGRVFLAGDAGHIHSPVGGQGMNTGIGDAINLAWKLAAVRHGQAGEQILDSYEPERLAFARRLVSTTDRLFTLATTHGSLSNLARTRLMPLLLRMAGSAIRPRLFRIVSQIQIEYRSSPLSQGRAGHVHAGDRLPWVNSPDNYASLSSLSWQVHVYGTPHPDLVAALDARHIPLHTFPWGPAVARAGLALDALYLLRPDGHVALADPTGRLEVLERYLTAHRLTPGAPIG